MSLKYEPASEPLHLYFSLIRQENARVSSRFWDFQIGRACSTHDPPHLRAQKEQLKGYLEVKAKIRP